jgi:hypothetical protein
MAKGALLGSAEHIQEVSGFLGNVETISDTTKTLLVGDSGKVFLLTASAGVAITLPTAYDGCHFKFKVVTAMSSSYTITIATAATTSLYKGRLFISDKDISSYDSTIAHFAADESDDDTITMSATTTGGLAGGWLELIAQGGHWFVDGHLIGDGNLATPFS